MKSYFQYELASKPLSIFNDVSLRKGTKSTILRLFKDTANKIPNKVMYVIDGGFLLHVAVWPRPAIYATALDAYCNYVLRHYGKNSIVVFDGYPDSPTTKGEEQRRRVLGKTSADLQFSEGMPTLCSQAAFLSNRNNKDKLIKLLISRLQAKGVRTHQAEADADVSIVYF